MAFESVFGKHFLPAKVIGVVPHPNKSTHSIKQLLWLEYEIKKPGHYNHHAWNGGEQVITLLKGQKVVVYKFGE